jgi:hypothetical protein
VNEQSQNPWRVLSVLLLASAGRLLAEGFVRHGLTAGVTWHSRDDLAECERWLCDRRPGGTTAAVRW